MTATGTLRPLVAVVLLTVAGVAPAVAAAPGPPAAGPDAGGPPPGVAGSAAQAGCSFPVTETDATGTEVTVEEAPERIAVLGPSAAQTLWEIGAKDRVVGLPHQYAGYLDGVEGKADLSGPGRSYVSVEKVVNTSPDLVLAPNVIAEETVSKLRDAGLTVYRFRLAGGIEDVYAKTRLTGRLVGECDGAAETVDWMRSRLRVVREAVAGEPRPEVLVSLGGGFTAGRGTFLHEIVETAGATNLAAEANVTGYREISQEVVVRRDPEWILQNGPAAGYPKTEAYNATTAVREGQVLTLNPDYASQPAPRLVYAVENVTKRLHPEAWAAANATTTTAGTTTTTADGTAGTTARDGTTGGGGGTTTGGQPGFGAGVALASVAVAGSVAALRRR